MDKARQKLGAMLRRLGKVHWNRTRGAFIVETELGAILQLCPNSDEDIRAGIHVDEITVPGRRRRRGAGTKAMAGLCRLADDVGCVLKGGPIGWSDDPRGEEFIAWLSQFGVEPDPSPPTQVHDRRAFYARRLPRPFEKAVRRL